MAIVLSPTVIEFDGLLDPPVSTVPVWGRNDSAATCGKPVACLRPVNMALNQRVAFQPFGGRWTSDFRGNVAGNVLVQPKAAGDADKARHLAG
jgi:hypothetical protein